jgi:hypothetical protein
MSVPDKCLQNPGTKGGLTDESDAHRILSRPFTPSEVFLLHIDPPSCSVLPSFRF